VFIFGEFGFRDILILDLDIGQTVGMVALDRSSPQILGVHPARHRDALFVLNECGALSMRVRRGNTKSQNIYHTISQKRINHF
jgi:hypothetical protein